VSMLPRSVSMLEGICIGIAEGFDVDEGLTEGIVESRVRLGGGKPALPSHEIPTSRPRSSHSHDRTPPRLLLGGWSCYTSNSDRALDETHTFICDWWV